MSNNNNSSNIVDTRRDSVWWCLQRGRVPFVGYNGIETREIDDVRLHESNATIFKTIRNVS